MLWSNYHQSSLTKLMLSTGKLPKTFLVYSSVILCNFIACGINAKVASIRILGLYHAKECDEVDLDKQIANLGIDFKIFMTRVDFKSRLHVQVHAVN